MGNRHASSRDEHHHQNSSSTISTLRMPSHATTTATKTSSSTSALGMSTPAAKIAFDINQNNNNTIKSSVSDKSQQLHFGSLRSVHDVVVITAQQQNAAQIKQQSPTTSNDNSLSRPTTTQRPNHLNITPSNINNNNCTASSGSKKQHVVVIQAKSEDVTCKHVAHNSFVQHQKVPTALCHQHACHVAHPQSAAAGHVWHYATPPPSLSDTSATSSSSAIAAANHHNLLQSCNNSSATCSSSSASSTTSSLTSSTLVPLACRQHHFHCDICNSRQTTCCNNATKTQLESTTIVSANTASSTLITPSQSRPNLANAADEETVGQSSTKKKPPATAKRKRSFLLSACMPLSAASPNSPLTPPADNNAAVQPVVSNNHSEHDTCHYCHVSSSSSAAPPVNPSAHCCNNNIANDYHCCTADNTSIIQQCHVSNHHHHHHHNHAAVLCDCHHQYLSDHRHVCNQGALTTTKSAHHRHDNNLNYRGYNSDGEQHHSTNHLVSSSSSLRQHQRRQKNNIVFHQYDKNGHATQTKQWLPPADSWNSGTEWRLPYGWEVAIDQTGRPYFINHEAKYTTYDDPRTSSLQSLDDDAAAIPPQPRTITLVRDPTIGFGFVASAEKPVIVRFVTEGGPSHGKLLPGDQIVQVNGEDVENSPREHVINLVRSSSSSVILRVCQPPPDANARKSALLNATKQHARQKNRRVTFADHGATTPVPNQQHVTRLHRAGSPPLRQPNNNATPLPMQQPPMTPSPQQQQQPFVPNVLKVFLENGQTKSFKYDAKTTVGDVIASLKEKLSIRHVEHFSLAIENVRSQRRNLLHFLKSDETIANIAARPTAQYLRCLFRLMFTPNEVNTLLQRDPVAFDYFYMQCCNDVVEERYANELRVDIALRLAALHMQQHAIANNLSGSATNVNKSVTVKLVEKECGLERFVPASILTTFNPKELRKILTTFIKLNVQYLAAPQGQKRVGEMQAKLSYIKLLSELPSFGGKCFNLLIYPPTTPVDASPGGRAAAPPQQPAIEALMLMSPKYGISQITATPNGNPIQLCHLHDVVEVTVRPNRDAGPSVGAAQSDIDATLIDMRVAVDNANTTVLTVGTESRDDLTDILCLLNGYALCEHHQLPVHYITTTNYPKTDGPDSSTTSLSSPSTVVMQNGDDPGVVPELSTADEFEDDEEFDEDEDDDEETDDNSNREPAPPYYGQHAILKMPWNFIHGQHVMSITLTDPASEEKPPSADAVITPQAVRRPTAPDNATTRTNDEHYSSNSNQTATDDDAEQDESSEGKTTPTAERRNSAQSAASVDRNKNDSSQPTKPPVTTSVSTSASTSMTTSTASSSPPSASSYDNLLAAVCSDDSEQQTRRLLQQQQHTFMTATAAKLQQRNHHIDETNVTEIQINRPPPPPPTRSEQNLPPYNTRACTKFIDESATSSEVDTPVVDAPHVISYLLTSNNTTTMVTSTSDHSTDYFSTTNFNSALNSRTPNTSSEAAKLFYQALSKVPPTPPATNHDTSKNQLQKNNQMLSQPTRHNGDFDDDDDDDEDSSGGSSAAATPTSNAARSPAHSAAVQANSAALMAVCSPSLENAPILNNFHRSCSSFGLQSSTTTATSPNAANNGAEIAFGDTNTSHVMLAAEHRPSAVRRAEEIPAENNLQNSSRNSSRITTPTDGSTNAIEPDGVTQVSIVQQEIIDLTLIPLPESSARPANGHARRKYSRPTIAVPPTPFRDDIDSVEQMFAPTTNSGKRPSPPPPPPSTVPTQQQQQRLARNAALLDETLQELDSFINQVDVSTSSSKSASSSNSHARSSSQDGGGVSRKFSAAKTEVVHPSTQAPKQHHSNVVVVDGNINNNITAGKPPPFGGISPVLGVRSKSATRATPAAGNVIGQRTSTLLNGGSSNRPSISGVDRPNTSSPASTLTIAVDNNCSSGEGAAIQRLPGGSRPRPPPRDRVRRKVLHNMLQKSLEDDSDTGVQRTNPESVSGESHASSTNSAATVGIPGSPCDLAVYMDMLAERTISKLDKLIVDMEWTATNYTGSRPPEHNPVQMRVARDQLVCEARRFVSTSKSFVKSASMAFTHQYYRQPASVTLPSSTSSMSEEHALVYVESLKRCTDLITMMYYSAQLVARAAQNGEQAAALMRGIMQVACTFRATVQASTGTSASQATIGERLGRNGRENATVTTQPPSSLKELMCEATKLAASLTALMRTIRATDMRDGTANTQSTT